MQVWGIRIKFGGAIENNEFKITRKSARNACLCQDRIFQETLGIVFFSKKLWDHILQSPEINPELYDPGIVFFSKPTGTTLCYCLAQAEQYCSLKFISMYHISLVV